MPVCVHALDERKAPLRAKTSGAPAAAGGGCHVADSMVPLSLKRARREPKAPETFVATPAPPPAELHAIARKRKRKSPDELPSDLLNGEAAASAPEPRAAPAPAPRADARGPKRTSEPAAPKVKESDVAKRGGKNLPARRPEAEGQREGAQLPAKPRAEPAKPAQKRAAAPSMPPPRCVAAPAPACAHAPPQSPSNQSATSLLGLRVEVEWKLEGSGTSFYAGSVTNAHKGRVYVEYDDGARRWHALRGLNYRQAGAKRRGKARRQERGRDAAAAAEAEMETEDAQLDGSEAGPKEVDDCEEEEVATTEEEMAEEEMAEEDEEDANEDEDAEVAEEEREEAEEEAEDEEEEAEEEAAAAEEKEEDAKADKIPAPTEKVAAKLADHFTSSRARPAESEAERILAERKAVAIAALLSSQGRDGAPTAESEGTQAATGDGGAGSDGSEAEAAQLAPPPGTAAQPDHGGTAPVATAAPDAARLPAKLIAGEVITAAPCAPVHRTGRVAGRVAVLTGGGSEIGSAVAQLLAAEGAKVVVGDADATSAAVIAARAGIGGACTMFTHTPGNDMDVLMRAAADRHGTGARCCRRCGRSVRDRPARRPRGTHPRRPLGSSPPRQLRLPSGFRCRCAEPCRRHTRRAGAKRAPRPAAPSPRARCPAPAVQAHMRNNPLSPTVYASANSASKSPSAEPIDAGSRGAVVNVGSAVSADLARGAGSELVELTRRHAADLASQKIRVNAVLIGAQLWLIAHQMYPRTASIAASIPALALRRR